MIQSGRKRQVISTNPTIQTIQHLIETIEKQTVYHVLDIGKSGTLHLNHALAQDALEVSILVSNCHQTTIKRASKTNKTLFKGSFAKGPNDIDK